MTAPLTFTCPRCGATSLNLHDIAEGYCGACHDWTVVLPDDYERAEAMGRAYFELGLTEDDVRVKTAGMMSPFRLAINQGWWRGKVDSARATFKTKREEM